LEGTRRRFGDCQAPHSWDRVSSTTLARTAQPRFSLDYVLGIGISASRLRLAVRYCAAEPCGLPVPQLLINRADLSVRVKLPGHYERPDEVVECTPLGYALLFPGASYQNERYVALLREHGAME
jgi:hypothetical protein